MKIKNHRDFWAGLLFLVIGVAVAITASGLALGSSADPGPGFFPLLLSLLMTLLGCIVVFKSLTFETDDGGPIGRVAWWPLLAVLGSVIGFALLAPLLGLLLTLPAMAYAIGRASGGLRHGWVGGLGTAAAGWLVFAFGFGVQLPMLPMLPG